SSVNAVCPADINGDGRTDLLLGGNLFTFPPQFGRLDASYGHVLLNDGKGSFTYIENRLSGILVRGEVKDIKEIRQGKAKSYLFMQNDSLPVLYRLQSATAR
ncbi:MAG: FG-GAP repeat protein, partial [Bacteroidota bacterium]|nr:FG-GAP repeat protein [Bacteroidota bacterium]